MVGNQPSASTALAVAPKQFIPIEIAPAFVVKFITRVTSSMTDSDQKCLKLLAIIFALAFFGQWIVYIPMTILSVILKSMVQLLLYLLKNEYGSPAIAYVLVGAAYGVHILVSMWLESAPALSRQHSHEKHPIDFARLNAMGYTPVATLHDFFQANPDVGADGKVYCPVIVAVVKSAHTVDSAKPPPRLTITSHLTSEGPRVGDDNKTTVEAGNDSSHSDFAPGDIPVVKGDIFPQDKPVAGPMNTAHVPHDSFAIAVETYTNTSAKEEEVAAARAKTDGHPKCSSFSSDDKTRSDDPTPSPASKGSPMMPPSSSESEVHAEADPEDDLSEHMDNVALPFPHLKHLTPVELDNLMKVHRNPTFHEGNLGVVFYDREKFDQEYPGIPDDLRSLIRPISDDGKDVDFMMEALRKHVPGANLPPMVEYIYSEDRFRKDSIGLNVLMTELELLWAQQKGGFADLEAVRNHEKEKTRRRRLPVPPGLKQKLPPGYKEFLSDQQMVKFNEGCADYDHIIPDAAESKFLCGLDARPGTVIMLDCLEDYLGNQILPWLDGVEEEELHDPNAQLPCECCKAALATHMEYRRKDEADDYRCPSDYQPPELTFLSKEALKEDQERKELEEAYFSAAGCPRAMTFRQTCDIHAVPTNLPWILMDGVEELNAILVGPSDDLPVPGFRKRTKYPDGYRMPQFFHDSFEHKHRLPRCEHGNKHPPFADQCLLCFSNDEYHGDCVECSVHADVRGIWKDPYKEELCDDWAKIAERNDNGILERVLLERVLLELVRAAADHEDSFVSWEQNTALTTYEENHPSWSED